MMMTGRRESLRPEVRSILQQFRVSADVEILNDTNLVTFMYKADRVRRMCRSFSRLREVVIWDDRPAQSESFCGLAREFPHLHWRVITVHPAQSHVVHSFNGALRLGPASTRRPLPRHCTAPHTCPA